MHRFGFARDLREDAVTCCACVYVCVWGGVWRVLCVYNAELVSSNQRRKSLPTISLSFPLSLIPVGDTVTSTSEAARHEREWVESTEVSHIMSREYPPRSRRRRHFLMIGFTLCSPAQAFISEVNGTGIFFFSVRSITFLSSCHF